MTGGERGSGELMCFSGRVNVSTTILYMRKAGSLTTEPRANGCCNQDRVELDDTNGEKKHIRFREKRAPDGRRSGSRRKYRGLAPPWRLPQKAEGTPPIRSRPRRTTCAGAGTGRPQGE